MAKRNPRGDETDHVFKVLLIGDSNVGKTSLLLQYTENRYSDTECTIGIDFKIKKLDVSSKSIKLQIWDTAGQEKFNTITTSYYKGAHGIIIVFDISNKQSFDSIPNWLNQIRRFSGPEASLVLVGHKIDLKNKSKFGDDNINLKSTVDANFFDFVDSSEAKEYADQAGIPYFEVSSKENINVEAPFLRLTEDILQRYRDSTPKRKNNTVNISDNNSNNGNCSC